LDEAVDMIGQHSTGPQDSRLDDVPKTSDSGEADHTERPREIGGRKGPEPTRFGDWEKNGRCIDF